MTEEFANQPDKNRVDPGGTAEESSRDSKLIVDEPPPFLGSWANVYAFVLTFLVFVIFTLWAFTRHYAPRSL